MSPLQVGHRLLQVHDAVQGVDVPTSLLYPTRAPPRPERFDAFTLDVATDAALEGRALPLVVLSHGTGSSPWLFRELAAHLARAGFVVALPRHPGNNRGDDGLAHTLANLENRPRHLSLVVDAAFADDEVGAQLSKARGVAIIGHSLGGYTALAVAGGHPIAGPNDTNNPTRPLDVVHDPRVRALVLLAPAMGWLSQEGALADVRLPILLRAGAEDPFTPPFHAEVVKRGVPDPSRVDLQLVPNAGHFSFMTPYPPELRAPELFPSQDPPGFDRARYHAALCEEVATFLGAALSPTP
jgi:predicted dienelactone hydrolase